MKLVEKRYYESDDGLVKGTYREVSEYESRRSIDGFEVKRLYCTNRSIDNIYSYYSYKFNNVYDNETRFKTDDLFIEYIENDGKYAIVSNDRVITEWVDNIGLYSVQYHPCKVNIGFSVYVHKGNKFGILCGRDGKQMLDSNSLRDIEYVGGWDEHGLPLYEDENLVSGIHYEMFGGIIDWIVDETIILDEYTRLVPKFEITTPTQCGYYLEVMNEKVPAKEKYVNYKSKDEFVRRNYYVIKNHPKPKVMSVSCMERLYETVGDFLDKWNSSTEEEKCVLRDGLGYCI